MNGHAEPMLKRINIDKVLSELTLVEKISLLTGSDLWHTTPLPDHGIPAVRLTDGRELPIKRRVHLDHLMMSFSCLSTIAVGVRGTAFFAGVPSNCFPVSRPKFTVSRLSGLI